MNATETDAKLDAALLPCPFCGYHARTYTRKSLKHQRDAGYGSRQFFVSCAADLECEAVLGGFPDANGAIAAWNRRAGQAHARSADAGLLAALERMVRRWEASNQNWRQAVADMQEACRHEEAVGLRNTALQALSEFPIDEARAAIAAAKGHDHAE